MAFATELSARAAIDIEEAFTYIYNRAPLNAVRWRKGLEERLEALKQYPEAFGFAPENKDAKTEVRQRLFGNYRVLYTIRGETVFILTVRHGAMKFLTGEVIDSIE